MKADEEDLAEFLDPESKGNSMFPVLKWKKLLVSSVLAKQMLVFMI
ncbi:hypothetical protein [Bacillus sp. THAF10]|nr:hypothetical protein [Bacillus sp. THAF10]